jgi:hypothetical protein
LRCSKVAALRCPPRIKIPVRLIHRPNLPQKSAKNAERSAEFWNSLRDSTAEYTKKTDSIQSLQFRVFSVFRSSTPGVAKPPTTRTTPKKLIPEKALLHGFHEFALIRVRTLLYPWFEFFHSRPFASLADKLSAGKPAPVPCPSAFICVHPPCSRPSRQVCG